MPKTKITYICQHCQQTHQQWMGQCTQCQSWNSIQKIEHNSTHYATDVPNIEYLNKITLKDLKQSSIDTNIGELNRVLGAGIVPGSVILLGGDPGIGKSTLMLQLAGKLYQNHPVLYVSGEESLQQIGLRATRLKLNKAEIELSNQTNIETILTQSKNSKAKILIIDSIQSIESNQSTSLPGSAAQLRECTLKLIRHAKQNHIAIWIIGHVTKEGQIAGPKVLEHMVDVVLYFEGEKTGRYRMIRAIKNRFGPVNELGIFVMTDHAIMPVNNPSTIFLQGSQNCMGNTVLVASEGSRFLLIEIQALVDNKSTSNKRLCLGSDTTRLNMMLAILNKYAHFESFGKDIFVNIVGGIKIEETAIDVPMVLALISSMKEIPLRKDLASFGEVGLTGEIRPVYNGEQRIKEAMKHGFKHIILPKSNLPKTHPKTLHLYPIEDIKSLLKHIETLSQTV